MTIRRLALGLAVVLTVGMFAVPTQAGEQTNELWQGTWNTAHEFGTPTLKLGVEGNSVSGKYFQGDELLGRIWGSLSKQGRVWTGRFKEKTGSKGKFWVQLKGGDTFEGWFKACGALLCSDPYTWTGQHA